jgi:hypothetical protein
MGAGRAIERPGPSSARESTTLGVDDGLLGAGFLLAGLVA